MYRKSIETTEELAKWYDRKYKEMGDGWGTPVEECNRHLDALGVPLLGKNKWLLDVGCGAGHFLAEAERRVNCLGVEISPVALGHANKRVTKSFLECGSIEDGIKSNAIAVDGFDYITSIGSLEHIIDLGKALDNVRKLLKPNGRWYFYCPNERWPHRDQPNERTMTDEEWVALFHRHGLKTIYTQRWGENQDNTVFMGVVDPTALVLTGLKLNCGSGQRPFDRDKGWLNIDSQPRWEPDVVADWNNLHMFEDESAALVVSHHSLEHVGCGEGDQFIKEAYRVLKPGGSLLVFVPDMMALARRYVSHQLDYQIYMTNVYGAYMGDEADRHAWGYDGPALRAYLRKCEWSAVKDFDWRAIEGAEIAKDWWILGVEAVK